MWSDNPAHSEFTARPSRLPTVSNHYRIHNTPATGSFTDTASIASNNVRPRPERACDLCRRRKTKCDGPSAPDNVCSNCTQNNQSCTYLCAYMHAPLSCHDSHPPLSEVSRPRGPPKAFVPHSNFLGFRLTSTSTLVMSLASRTVWRRWRHCSRECVPRESINTTPF